MTAFLSIFDHFLKITKVCPKLFRIPDERSRTFSENFENVRGVPKIAEDLRIRRRPKMFLSHTNEFNYNLGDKLNISDMISSLERIWKLGQSCPGCSLV